MLHARGDLTAQPWGTREFTAVDLDNNALIFFEPTPDAGPP